MKIQTKMGLAYGILIIIVCFYLYFRHEAEDLTVLAILLSFFTPILIMSFNHEKDEVNKREHIKKDILINLNNQFSLISRFELKWFGHFENMEKIKNIAKHYDFFKKDFDILEKEFHSYEAVIKTLITMNHSDKVHNNYSDYTRGFTSMIYLIKKIITYNYQNKISEESMKIIGESYSNSLESFPEFYKDIQNK